MKVIPMFVTRYSFLKYFENLAVTYLFHQNLKLFTFFLFNKHLVIFFNFLFFAFILGFDDLKCGS